MNLLEKINFKFIHKLDLFGREINLYYKGNEKKNTYLGCFFSLGFLIICLSFSLYKINRMIKKKDLIFYDTFEHLEKPPSIQLTKDVFYGGFALEHPITYDPFIDETIYYPKAYFKRGTKNGDKWSFEIKELELERCKLEKFGKVFQDKIIHHSLNDLYCFKELNEILEGHFSYGMYSFIYIQFFPCKNSSENNNHCKNIEAIDFYLNNTFLCLEMEDIQLTPYNYTYPVRGRNQDIYFSVGKKLFQEVHVFYQLVNIETDLDIIGFNKFEKMKSQKYLKYYSQYQMTNLMENNIYITGEAFSSVTLKLFDEIRIQKRSYTTIIEVLGNVGGLMEVLFLSFKIICFFSVNILYELSIINNLFEFDLDQKLIFIQKKKKDDDLHDTILDNNNKKLNFKIKNEYLNINCDSINIQTKLNSNNNLLTNKKLTIVPFEPRDRIILDKSSFLGINKSQNKTFFFDDKKNIHDIDKFNSFGTFKKKESNNLIKKIYINRIYICLFFCFIRKKKNVQNILLNEGMKIFTEKMDIICLFKKLLKKEDNLQEFQIFKMSSFCKENLRKINII